jgi:hypothetical protein
MTLRTFLQNRVSLKPMGNTSTLRQALRSWYRLCLFLAGDVPGLMLQDEHRFREDKAPHRNVERAYLWLRCTQVSSRCSASLIVGFYPAASLRGSPRIAQPGPNRGRGMRFSVSGLNEKLPCRFPFLTPERSLVKDRSDFRLRCGARCSSMLDFVPGNIIELMCPTPLCGRSVPCL